MSGTPEGVGEQSRGGTSYKLDTVCKIPKVTLQSSAESHLTGPRWALRISNPDDIWMPGNCARALGAGQNTNPSGISGKIHNRFQGGVRAKVLNCSRRIPDDAFLPTFRAFIQIQKRFSVSFALFRQTQRQRSKISPDVLMKSTGPEASLLIRLETHLSSYLLQGPAGSRLSVCQWTSGGSDLHHMYVQIHRHQ